MILLIRIVLYIGFISIRSQWFKILLIGLARQDSYLLPRAANTTTHTHKNFIKCVEIIDYTMSHAKEPVQPHATCKAIVNKRVWYSIGRRWIEKSLGATGY
jgi:hypothetical protein